MEYITNTLLQVVRRVCWWKNFDNRSITSENNGQKCSATFLWTKVYYSWGRKILVLFTAALRAILIDEIDVRFLFFKNIYMLI